MIGCCRGGQFGGVFAQGVIVDLSLSAITKPLERLVATAQNGYEVARFGGLETGAVPSPFQIVESTNMYKLRRYFPPDTRPGMAKARPNL